MPKKTNIKEITPKSIQKLVDQVDDLKENIESVNKKLVENVSLIHENIKKVEEEIAINKDQNEETIRTQEDIIISMIHKFNDEFLMFKNKVIEELESVKEEIDIMKISFTINENQLVEKMKTTIREELKNIISGKEDELLMKLWINELKEILSNFENLKNLHPKEFNLQIEEIANTIEVFKQKLREI